jgi:PII-like signaling protein
VTSDATPRRTHAAVRLAMYFDARDRDGRGSLLVHLMARARHLEMRGATAREGYEGFGASGRTHTKGALRDEAPVVVLLVDSAERVDAFLAQARDLTENVLVTLTNVDVVEF